MGLLCQAVLCGARKVFDYLGRYTHRVAISNHRFLSMDEKGVTFVTKGSDTVTLPTQEFIRRFLLHVLPNGFVKIRHYGLMASSNATTKLEAARNLLADLEQPESESSTNDHDNEAEEASQPGWQALLLALTGVDLSICPRCRKGKMLRRPLRTAACPRAPLITDTS